MACSVSTVLTNLCTSQIGQVKSEVQLLQIIAQLTAEELVVISPGTTITPAAILARGCTSGITMIKDPLMLLRIIAQNGCELDT